MFDIGWSELVLIGAIALIVVGPKDLPDMFRQIGRFTSKAKSMAREFSHAMEDAAKESGVHDVAGDLRKIASPKSMGLDTMRNAATKFESWDPLKSSRDASVKKAVEAEEIRHSAASVTAAPVMPPPKEVPVPPPAVRARPKAVRRRAMFTESPRRRAVPRRPTPKK
ncbi:Sec-independent protein translocase protein TatB [Falsirhodobacter halotolerans]|uniref:Sec-independent protein translocase protein TatB n=1 Tax=Falsirhodobacter halotolerans TaxID=1146892 RepID=UPI001FD25883|nr:Sec-independent protein translocase protein TatB [Falsirhodobacter halotolerans]MCJ8140179.1 Sec-independent protein translocase protein TatB [Falsirhodobacter halotolerans]